MKKLLYSLGVLTICLSAVLFGSKAQATPTQLVSSTWHLTGNNGDAQAYGPNGGDMSGKASLTITYDLHGTCFGAGTASALIFDQGGNWRYIPLSNYGTNCQNGQQTVTIPLSAWVAQGLNLSQSVGTFHVRFWHGSAFTVDIYSAVLNDSNVSPTVTASRTPATTLINTPVSFSATGTDTDGTIASYAWTFGDGGTSTSQNPSHSFTATGTYTSTVTVTDNQGATGTASVTTTVTAPVRTWDIQAVDTMKDSKDKLCNQLTQTQIDQRVAKALELGVTHVAISTPYYTVTCSGSPVDPLPYTIKWVSSIRAAGLKVWHRHPGPKFEGIYSQTKSRSPDGYRHIKYITDFIALDGANPTLIESGDIFTPEAEPQNGGISGVTYCGNPSNCQFSSAADFNEWLRLATLSTKLALAANDITNVKVGYWGFDGFLVWGNNNPDHQGTSKLEASTVAAMDNIIAIDHYPSGGDTMATNLDEARAVWPSADFFIGEWGTTGGGTSQQLIDTTTEAFNAFAARPWVKGVSYWHLGPDGIGEALINFDMTNRPHFDTVKSYFLHP